MGADPPPKRRPSLALLLAGWLVLGACSEGAPVAPTSSPAPTAPSVAPRTARPSWTPSPRSPTVTPPSPEPDGRGVRANALVLRAVDGDTIAVRFRGRTVTVRLIGVDTPESVAPGQPVECYALAASRYTARRLEGERVRLELDVERIDRYGRMLAYVWLGDELFNETLVREGYAVVATYPPNVRYVERFTAAQREARAHERGLWGRCVPATGPAGSAGCDPAYPDVCIPPPPPDLDCADVPYRRFTVRPPDPHSFDGDHDGIGCET